MPEITPTADPQARPDPEAFKDAYTVEDEAALQLCVQDAQSAQAWIDAHYLSIRWIEADVLYQSPPVLKVWEGTNIPRSNISLFTVATHVNAILAKVLNGLFFETPPFVLRPKPGLDSDTARAITAVVSTQLDQTGFFQSAKRGLFSAILFGTGIWKFGWKDYQKTKKSYRRKEPPKVVQVLGKSEYLRTARSDEFDVTEESVNCSEPCFEDIDIRNVLVDPGCRTGDIRDAKFVIHKRTVTYRELMELSPQLGYDLPPEEEVRSWFMPPNEAADAQSPVIGDSGLSRSIGSSAYLHHAAPQFAKTTEDPLDEPLELLERWDDCKVISVLQKVKVLRNGVNPFGCKPFLGVNWWDISDAFWGMGLGMLLSGEQRLQQGLTNASADITSLVVNPTVVRSRGANVTSQNIRQRLGGIVDVDGPVDRAFTYMEVPQLPPSVFAMTQESQARAESVSGANEILTMGAMPSRGRTSLGRTATGAAGMEDAANSRVGAFIEDFNRQVFQPFLYNLHEMNKEFLPMQTLREILNSALGDKVQIEEETFLNSMVDRFEILAGSHLAVKQQMAQAVGLMVEVFQSPQTMQELAKINGEYVDVAELLKMITDVSGFRNYYSIVKKMTPEMQQALQAQNPAVIQAQAKGAQQQQQFQNQQSLIDQKDINRAVVLSLRQVLEQAVKPEAVSGEPTGQGFGANEPS